MKISSSAGTRSAVALALLSTAFAAPVMGQSFTDFENFTTGVSVNGQGGWSATKTNPNWDEEVVQLTGNKAWRVSNEVYSGSFGDQPIANPSGLYAGETGSTHLKSGNPAVTNTFYASFDIWPVTNDPQPGLDVTVSPDDGQGSRQSFVSIEDNGNGIDIDFYDTDANHPDTNQNEGFRLTEITGLSYDRHTIAIEITFVDGLVIDQDGTVHGNDIVNLYIDGSLAHTGTTWESYFWTTTEGQSQTIRAVDTLLFRLSTSGFAGDGVGGFYIDNVLIDSAVPSTHPGTALFNVTKTFADGRTDPVDVTLTCSSGLPLQQTATIAGGDPTGVSFVVDSIPDSGAECTVTESGGPDGYEPVFNDGQGCTFASAAGEDYSCAILNQAGPATLTIATEWLVHDDFNDSVNMTANLQLRCSVPFDGAALDGVYLRDYVLQGQSASVEVTGIDTNQPGDGNWCYVVDTGAAVSGLETDNGCGSEADPIVFGAGSVEACTVSYTMFFEGIPSLNAYGLAVMALLMLGAGFVGMRRFA